MGDLNAASSDAVRKDPMARIQAAIEFAHQAERLGQYAPHQEDEGTGPTQAVKAKFITAQDAVIETADGSRLPGVPVEEALRLNKLRDIVDERDPSERAPIPGETRVSKDGTIHGARPVQQESWKSETDAPLMESQPPTRTNPLFPPLPMYGPPTPLKSLQIVLFRISSAILSCCFLLVIILGAHFTSIPDVTRRAWMRWNGEDPDKDRPFYREEERRRRARRVIDRAWRKPENGTGDGDADQRSKEKAEEFVPLEGGPDPVVCDIRYYARRVGLDCEVFDVQTEDGFIIELWHLYNPREYSRTDPAQRSHGDPEVFFNGSDSAGASGAQYRPGEKRYPVLMIHGLLQSAGAYCTNDDDSLAFFLAKSGYDVWLGNNRCGFHPRHQKLKYSDPRMWSWNIRQMGVMDLPALISRVLAETGFEKLGLIAHSQGTTQTFVALAKEQRPEIGDKVSVFCALAPAAYAGPLIGKMYFKFMRLISPAMFRVVFGIHAFIPLMMVMYSLLPSHLYGVMGYRIFSFLFNWSDERWERDLRDRMFQFAPVYVSAESMRWWLGRECFAKHKCILATREEKIIEDREDALEDMERSQSSGESSSASSLDSDEEDAQPGTAGLDANKEGLGNRDEDRARYAWYGPRTPPFALWVCGADDLVDGRRLLRRFERNREPFVDVVHSKIIEGYEHLDVIWAMDAIEKVGKEVREVIWRTAPEEARRVCRVPRGCGGITDFYQRRDGRDKRGVVTREIDASAGEWSEKGAKQVGGGGGDVR
ncbi:ab-hydrolase associated lipase-like protein [Westerdykella ornata]|uniref:Ab-hydrolase associated lipase-like protein n=1 Tax=Westerdykella ornata TaxID=318751 RepID=A0A6A6JYM8_WESOR|nr:ab-hydrolase associated lipase-like protein [Westerdykella ornata]KAF2281334.1 ab-hydrolase associated lipase-like protein [Westerdykella ornata]